MKRLYKRKNGLTVSYNPYSKPKYIVPRRADWDFWDNKRYTYNGEILPDNTLSIIGSEDDYKLSYFKDDNGHYWDGGYVLLPEIEVNANYTAEDWFNNNYPYVDASLQRSIDVTKQHPEIYGNIGSYLTPKGIRDGVNMYLVDSGGFDKEYPGIVGLHKPIPGFRSNIFLRYGKNYVDFNKENTVGVNEVLAHELNHELYWKYLFNSLYGEKSGLIQKILDDAYPVDSKNYLNENSCFEKAAVNTDVRNYLFDNGFDVNDYDFLSFDKDGAHSKLPLKNGYLATYRRAWENYANNRYNELIHERGEDHADEIKQEITDEVNLKIRKALSTIAYNLNRNQDSPLYAKSGGILRFLPGGNTGLTVVGKGNLAKKATGFVSKNIYTPILGAINKISPTVAKFLGYNRAQEDEALRRAMEESPKVTNIENDNKPANATQQFKNNVQRALKISKTALFKELVNGLELDDRVSLELISRYDGLDPTTQSTERKMLLRLMKNNQIHSIADFDLAVDKVHSNKMGGNPNILGIKTISDLDTPFAESWEQKLREKLSSEEAFGRFGKRNYLPEIGYSSYSVPGTALGLLDLLHVMLHLYNKKIQPWCILQTDPDSPSELSDKAKEYWNENYPGDKIILVDNKGKIRYCMGNGTFFDLRDRPVPFFVGTKPIEGSTKFPIFEYDSKRIYKAPNSYVKDIPVIGGKLYKLPLYGTNFRYYKITHPYMTQIIDFLRRPVFTW